MKMLYLPLISELDSFPCFLYGCELVNSKIDLINFEFIWEQFHSNLKHANPKIAIDMNLNLLKSSKPT